MTIAAIGYLRIASTDPNAFTSFCTDMLGLMHAGLAQDGHSQLLRMDAHPFRFRIEPSESDQLLALGLEIATESEWQQLVERLERAGHSCEMGSAQEAALLGVQRFFRLQDPSANTIELYYGRTLSDEPFQSSLGIDRFITADDSGQDMGFGHVVVPAPECDETTEFYTTLLGMSVCDVLSLAQPPSKVVFMHADNPRQHSVALYDQPSPAGVVHIMVEVGTLDEVGLALDRAERGGHPIVASLGRHVNDNMCSFYVLAPGGIPFEYGYDGLQIKDWGHYTATESTEGDLWGHAYSFPGPPD
ncbi:MAG: VOC family protein [Pseudomonadota bacterium]